MMALSEVEAVLQFLRKNGFLEAENALKQDIVEKSHLGMFDFEKFLFPMVPLPPPVRIPASSRRPEAGDGGGDDGMSEGPSSDEDDQFVSLGSSTSDVCSSEFINPYGLRSTSIGNSEAGNSEASSDRMSQFGTARDYPDFDMQNDLWYDEKDDGHFLTPSFQALDAFGCPSEDKHIMTSGTSDQFENSFAFYNDRDVYNLDENIDYLDKPCLYNTASINKEHTAPVSNGRAFEKKSEVGFFKDKGKDFTDYKSSDPLWKPSGETREFYGSFLDENYMNIKQTDSDNLDVKHGNGDNGSAEQLVSKSINSSTINGVVKDWTDKSRNITGSHSMVFEKDSFSANEKWGCVDDVEENGGADEAQPAIDETDDNSSADEILIRNMEEDEYEIFDLRIIHRKNRTGFEENKDLPIVLNSVIAGRYYVTEYLGSAAFSRVVQAHDLYTGMDVCLKIIKNDKDFFDQSLDEIKLLKLVNKHDPADERHILRLYDYFYHQEHLFIVCELLRANLYEFQKFNEEAGGEAYFTLERIQVITRQCLEALEYLHDLGIIHCDLKPENILIKSYRRSEIKIIDLGSSCFNSDNLCLYVQSRSYRAPEVMLGLAYDQKIDIWSLGCILAELYSGEVLFPNESVVMILARMVGMLGPIDLDMLDKGQETPKYFTEEYDLYYIHEDTSQLEYIIPEESSLEHHLQISDVGFLDFLRSLLEINPKKRPTAREALEHPWLSYKYSISC